VVQKKLLTKHLVSQQALNYNYIINIKNDTLVLHFGGRGCRKHFFPSPGEEFCTSVDYITYDMK